MKKIVIILLLWSITATAQVPLVRDSEISDSVIRGAFGIQLGAKYFTQQGDVFDQQNPLDRNVIPPRPSSAFQHYSVDLTPHVRLVHRIRASKTYDSIFECKNAHRAVDSALTKKYGVSRKTVISHKTIFSDKGVTIALACLQHGGEIFLTINYSDPRYLSQEASRIVRNQQLFLDQSVF